MAKQHTKFQISNFSHFRDVHWTSLWRLDDRYGVYVNLFRLQKGQTDWKTADISDGKLQDQELLLRQKDESQMQKIQK